MPYKRISGIYQIQSKIHTEQVYIGSAVSIKDRWRWHRNDLEKNKHDNQKLQNHYNKYGIENFIFSIVETCEKDVLIEREQYYFDTLNPWFNILKVAGRPVGHKVPQWLREKLRIINTGRKDSPETTRRRSESHKGLYGVNNGRKFSEEVNRANSQRNMGEKNGFFGKHHTQESINKMKATKQLKKELGLTKPPWNKGLTKDTSPKLKDIGINISKAMKSKYIK